MILLAIANAFWCCGSHFHLVVLDVTAAKGASAWDRLTHMSLQQFTTPTKDQSSFRVFIRRAHLMHVTILVQLGVRVFAIV